MRYVFYYTDETEESELDIEGDDFRRLLDICFSHCTVMSFLKNTYNNQDDEYFERLAPYRIPTPQNISCQPVEACPPADFRFYRLCPELKEVILSIFDHLFRWLEGWGYHHPADPIFYREDGSMFFWSCIHEGSCALLPREGEDVTSVLKHGAWYDVTDRGVSSFFYYDWNVNMYGEDTK